MREIELLAPAGDSESLKTAINNGADAVYLGMSGFNARASASNFTKDTVEAAVRLAHLFDVKVYITFNTLIKNSEVSDFIDLVDAAVAAKADGFIVQDIGAAAILKKCFPGIRLHASTQLGVHNLYGAEVCERLGFERAVLSRETKLNDIKEIAEKTKLDLEYFVQGALCVSFSGNCYMSALENGNSGNRGRCLQLCRLPYGAVLGSKKHKEEYLLSPSDLCLIDSIKTLADAGVGAFKIEGRLRRPGYVAEAVACYRKAIDDNFPASNRDKIEKLQKVFFRGEYIKRAYLDRGVPDKIINKQHQNHIGVTIGTVAAVKRFKDIFAITISTAHSLVTGDGIKFFDGDKQIGSIGVGNVDVIGDNIYRVFGKVKPEVGAKVNLILDKASEDKALARTKKLAVSFKITAKEGAPLKIFAQCGEVCVVSKSEYIVPKAVSAPTAPNEISAQVSKLGTSQFRIERIDIDAEDVFIPKSVINETRRNLLHALENEIISFVNRKITVARDAKAIMRIKAKAAEYAAASQVSQAPLAYVGQENGGGLLKEDNISVIYPAIYDKETLSRLIAEAEGPGHEPCLRLPTIASGEDIRLIEKLLEGFPTIKTLLINNIYGFAFASKGYRLIAGWGLNIYNNFAYEAALSFGAEKVIASIETAQGELCGNENLYKYLGKGFPVMTLAHCPYKTLYGNGCENCVYNPGLTYTRERRVYPVVRHKASQCYFELTADI